MANEIYTKKEIIESLDEILKDEYIASRFLFILSKNKLDNLIKQHNVKHDLYTKRYEPIIKRNAGKPVDQYDISNIMVKKINKASTDLTKSSKNINGYRSLVKNHEETNHQTRINKIVKKIMKLFNLMSS